jgi:hypothetical protein
MPFSSFSNMHAILIMGQTVQISVKSILLGSKIDFKRYIYKLKIKDEIRSLMKPPTRSKNVLTDFLNFMWDKPKIPTLIKFESEEKRIEYNERILQRIGLNVDKLSILNIHKIGVEAPVSLIFNELLHWDGDSTCWPNYVAQVDRIDGNLEQIRILPFGWKKYPLRLKSFFGIELIPLFYLNSIRIKQTPDPFDFDNARYLLYDCSGGYPIGFFSLYVRSSIPELGETEHSQLISAVGFNFYGKEQSKTPKVINRIWEAVHNRVTANVLNRLKQLCEWRLEKIESGIN